MYEETAVNGQAKEGILRLVEENRALACQLNGLAHELKLICFGSDKERENPKPIPENACLEENVRLVAEILCDAVNTMSETIDRMKM